MTERRYNEDEVAEIFQRASTEEVESDSSQPRLPSSTGMTLAELEQIGRDVGIAPGMIRQAALSLDRAGQPSGRRFLGLPVGVGHTVDLDRRLSDEEWERLVVDLRETFDARGTVRQDGSLRQWTNGNLQALLEPTPGGQRLRLRTFKGNAPTTIAMGAVMIGAGLFSIVSPILSGLPVNSSRLVASALIMGVGFVGAASSVLRLPAWAKLRRQQMKAIAERLTLLPPAKPEG
jgi:hypothetical protein